MLPLIPLALSVVPELIRMIAGDRAGVVAGRVADVVQAVTGTTEPTEAQRKLADDPALATTLRLRLAEIALETQRAMDQAAEQKRQGELAELQKALKTTQGVRTTLLDLVRATSPVAWGAPAVSVIVTLGFFVFLTVLITLDLREVNPTVASIVNITIGTLAAAFATVVNFRLGSSQGSRTKDAAMTGFQATWPRPPEQPPTPPSPTPPPSVSTAPPDTVFEQCLAVVLDKEGGFTDHPRERGGPTHRGITLATLAQWKGLSLDETSSAGRET